jgi:hypothetical protein
MHLFLFVYTVTWRIITGWGLDDRFYWHFYDNCNQWLRLAPFLAGLWVSSLPLWLITNEESWNSLMNESNNPWVWRESYTTSDSQLASLSWNKAPIWGLQPDLYCCQTVRVCWCGALSLMRGSVCLLQLLLDLASAVILGSEFLRTRDHILLSQIRDYRLHRLLRLAGLRWR